MFVNNDTTYWKRESSSLNIINIISSKWKHISDNNFLTFFWLVDSIVVH